MPALRLEGITGSSDGVMLIATGLDEAKLQHLKRLPRLKLNVCSIATDDALAKKVGVLDVLVNCAGSEAVAWGSTPALRPFRHARAAPPVFRRG